MATYRVWVKETPQERVEEYLVEAETQKHAELKALGRVGVISVASSFVGEPVYRVIDCMEVMV